MSEHFVSATTAAADSGSAGRISRRRFYLVPVASFAVLALPETFVSAKDGSIALKHIGPLTSKDLEDAILPLIRRVRQQ
jgi:hypothetical protein